MRIFPEIGPSSTWPFSSLTPNVPLGRFSITSPCIWMTSSLAISCSAAQRRLEVGLLQQRFVLLAHQVVLHLGHEVHGDHHDDQQRSPAEIEGHVVLQDQELRQ